MKRATATLALAAAALLAGCASPSHQACRLLTIALDEAQMAEAWYIETGEVLTRCGVAGAAEAAESKACYARRFNDNSVVCP